LAKKGTTLSLIIASQYKTKQFQKFQQLSNQPAKLIVDKIKPLINKIDSVKDAKKA